jgi:hypothetical protein
MGTLRKEITESKDRDSLHGTSTLFRVDVKGGNHLKPLLCEAGIGQEGGTEVSKPNQNDWLCLVKLQYSRDTVLKF